MEANQTVRTSATEHLPGKPAVYEIPPQDDTARFYAKTLMRILKSGRKLDNDEQEWMNIYNRYKTKGKKDSEEEDEISRKDLLVFFMDKIARLQIEYENKVNEIRRECDRRLEAKDKILAEKDKRIDDLIAEAQKLRDAMLTEILKIVNTGNNNAIDKIEGAHNRANGHLVSTLQASNSLSTSLANSVSTQWNNATELSKKHFTKLQEILEKEEGPGYFETFLEQILVPNIGNIKEAVKKGVPYLLQGVQK